MYQYQLFSTPTFFSGMASVLDLGNTLNIYNEAPHTHLADFWAIWSDWNAIGDDLAHAAAEYGKNQKQARTK